MPKVNKEILTPDPKNANRGTEQGAEKLRDSLQEYGGGRSILVDRDGTIIAGNKTYEAARKLGLPIQIIETNGESIVAVKRVDLSIEDQKGRALAYADNRVAELDLDWDTDQITEDFEAEIGDVDRLFDTWNFDALTGKQTGEVEDNHGEWQGMPAFDNPGIKPYRSIKVSFATMEDFEAFVELIDQPIGENERSIFFPEQEVTAQIGYRVQSDDEEEEEKEG